MTGFGKLNRRSDFTAARKGRRAHAPTLTAQIVRRAPDAAVEGPRVGLTVTKKIGDAVERNRIKRRLRAVLRNVDATIADPVADHVLIAKREALTVSFDRLSTDVAHALTARTPKPRAPRSSDPSSAGA